MNVSYTLITLLLLGGCSSAVTTSPAAAPNLVQKSTAQSKGCTAAELTLSFDGADGDFNGMSHSGTYLILTNKGSRSCSVPRRPELTFLDAKGSAIDAKANVPPGMHPGPVMVPLKLAPAASAQSGLRWVSGEVYDHSACADVAKTTVKLDAGEVSAPMPAHLCGEAGAAIRFDEPWLQPK